MRRRRDPFTLPGAVLQCAGDHCDRPSVLRVEVPGDHRQLGLRPGFDVELYGHATIVRMFCTDDTYMAISLSDRTPDAIVTSDDTVESKEI